jgi:hypothetical protein
MVVVPPGTTTVPAGTVTVVVLEQPRATRATERRETTRSMVDFFGM